MSTQPETIEDIIFVDDEIHVLESMKRQLRKRYKITTALSGKDALEKFAESGPFAVVVSDMRMPEMDGIQLLSIIKDMYPDTIRMMLTGNADQETAAEAVNKGQIFRFLNKPCPSAQLITSLALALRQYRLQNVEKDLLNQTLKGSVKVLSELLSFTNPHAFSIGVRIRPLVMRIAEELPISAPWQIEIAAMMSQIGCVTLPHELLNKISSNLQLNVEEKEMYSNHPQVGASLLRQIPRLEGVAKIVQNQFKHYSAFDPDDEDDEINLATQILKAVVDYTSLVSWGTEHDEALKAMSKKKDIYNPEIVLKLELAKQGGGKEEVVSVHIKDLVVGMKVEENIMAQNGTLLAPKGQEITLVVRQGLVNFSKHLGVREPVKVRISVS